MTNDYPELPAKEQERIKRREEKKRPKMVVHGRSILTLAKIIQEKVKGERPLTSKRKKKRKKRKR